MEKTINKEVNVSLEDAVERLFLDFWRDQFPNTSFEDSGPTGSMFKRLFLTSFSTGLNWHKSMVDQKLSSAVTTIKDVHVLIKMGKLGNPGSMFFEEFYERTVNIFPELNIVKPKLEEIKNE